MDLRLCKRRHNYYILNNQNMFKKNKNKPKQSWQTGDIGLSQNWTSQGMDLQLRA